TARSSRPRSPATTGHAVAASWVTLRSDKVWRTSRTRSLGRGSGTSEQLLLVAVLGVDRRGLHHAGHPTPGQVVHEHPAAAVDGRRTQSPQRRLVPRARIPLV